MQSTGSLPTPRRPIAPRVADRSVPRPRPTASQREIAGQDDNPVRGWRVIPAIPLVDRAWRRGIETNVVACFLTARRRGGRGEFFMASVPYIATLACFGVIAFSTRLSEPEIWWFVILLALVMAALSLFMGGLLMGWGIRRHLVGLSVEQLMVTPLKAESIVRGLAFGPVWRVSAMAILVSLCVPLIEALTVWRSGLPFSGYWTVLGLLGFSVSCFGSVLMGQLGASIALRAHIYIRQPSMATARTFLDLLRVFLILGLLVVLVMWLCAMIVVGVSLLTGNSTFSQAFGIGGPGFSGFVESLAKTIVIGALAIGAIAGICYILWRMVGGLLNSMDSAIEFTYLYPEEWWIRQPGRGAEEDTYRLATPWIAPHSERMIQLRSRAS
jgi:hypothetical protein